MTAAAHRDPACLFCRIIAGELPAVVVHDTPRTLAFRDLAPLAPEHVLVVPKSHFATAAVLAETDPGYLGEVMATATEVAALCGLAGDGYRLVVNTGRDGGQTVEHLHVHVLGGRRLGLLG
ncbi:MAG: histidine triad nucleotide-binding protein [Actinomycetota bacterium]|nr:histidine triad nucleotide-binding protein [Actinomycetota bacterium]